MDACEPGSYIDSTGIFSGFGLCNEQQSLGQGLSEDLETGCLKLAIVKFWGPQIFKGYHNILRFQP